MNNYGAFFSAETLRTFPYKKKYENFMDLENFRLLVLWNDNKGRGRGWLSGTPFKGYYHRGETMYPECAIIVGLIVMIVDMIIRSGESYTKCLESKKERWTCDTRASEEKAKWRTTENLLRRIFPVPSNVEAIEKSIRAIVDGNSNGTAVAFVTLDYEFQHNEFFH